MVVFVSIITLKLQHIKYKVILIFDGVVNCVGTDVVYLDLDDHMVGTDVPLNVLRLVCWVTSGI